MSKTKTLWMVMRAMQWESITVNGFQLNYKMLPSGGFAPFFLTREEALEWAHGDASKVMPMYVDRKGRKKQSHE